MERMTGWSAPWAAAKAAAPQARQATAEVSAGAGAVDAIDSVAGMLTAGCLLVVADGNGARPPVVMHTEMAEEGAPEERVIRHAAGL